MSAPVNQAQERAAWAWKSIDDAVRDLSGKDQGSYGLLVKKLPSWLQVSGLGQTLAFLFSKPKSLAQQKLFTQLTQRIGAPPQEKRRAEGMKLVTEMTPQEYRRASYELSRCAELLKRFADGRIDTDSAEREEGR